MNIPVWYCEKLLDLEISDSLSVDLYDLPSKRLEPVGIDHWINSGKPPDGFEEFVENSRSILVVINDAFRPTPTSRILKALGKSLDLKKSTFLVATGLHDSPDDKSLLKIFENLLPQIKNRVHSHSAFDNAQLVQFGSGKTMARLNRHIQECDSILLIGSVEPHYFAGYTGGRKMILPGCASF